MRSLRLLFGIGILAGSAAFTGCSGAAGIFSGHQDGSAGTGGQAGAPGADAGDAGNMDASTGNAGHPGCDPTSSPKTHPCAVNNQHGIFINATGGSDDTGDGTEQHPYQTFKKGIDEATASGKRLFACAGEYDESVQLTSANNGIQMYGGFDCSNWAYTGDKTEVKNPTNSPALGMDTVDGAHIEDIDFTSADAVTPGDSSVAASVSKSQKIELVDVVLTAGTGAAGLDAAPFTSSAAKGTDGNPGNAACSADTNPGGLAATTACGSNTSVGGKGGEGAVGGSNGGAGDNGTPDLGKGVGGAGQRTSSWDCSVGGANGGGQSGGDGATGNPGAGATGLGTLDATGVTGVPGDAGTAGKPGQGGGGGGGAQAPNGASSLVCTGLSSNVGASGGGGGGGGCGGQGGPGGGPGGSSIALVSISSDILLTNSQLIAADGGGGGKGALGQLGGDGGKAGDGGGRDGLQTKPGCPGGLGGLGGSGGPGGGGTGGHSIAIAYTGTAPLTDASTTMTEATTAAQGGLGGGDKTTNQGADGVTRDLQQF